jgi:hypothetical protein
MSGASGLISLDPQPLPAALELLTRCLSDKGDNQSKFAEFRMNS